MKRLAIIVGWVTLGLACSTHSALAVAVATGSMIAVALVWWALRGHVSLERDGLGIRIYVDLPVGGTGEDES